MKKFFITVIVTLILVAAHGQPSGTIMAFGGPKNKVPTGWVLCDGKLLDRTNPRFSNLFNAIGTSWGGDGGNRFAVPDLRGLFLRGVSDTTGLDPDAADRLPSRINLNSTGNRGNTVGSKQTDEFKRHTHDYKDEKQPAPNTFDSGGGRGLQDHTRTTSPAGGNETRPVNAYVFYIIKL